MALPRLSSRTIFLAGLATFVTSLAVYDLFVGLPDRNGSSWTGTKLVKPVANRSTGRTAQDGETIAELESIIRNAEVIRQRYKFVAVPYAESIAGFSTLYLPGEVPRDKANAAIRGLISSDVEIREMQISETSSSASSLWLTATVSLSSGNSKAMINALLALGDASNGMVWKELSLGVDEQRKQISATGSIRLLMARLAE